MKRQLKQFYVLNWDHNKDMIEHYEVLPYFRDCWEKKPKSQRPENKEELKNFIQDNSRYMFWSRCEYEMICHGWPKKQDDYKIDIHEQIMMNIDIIVDILAEEFKIQ